MISYSLLVFLLVIVLKLNYSKLFNRFLLKYTDVKRERGLNQPSLSFYNTFSKNFIQSSPASPASECLLLW